MRSHYRRALRMTGLVGTVAAAASVGLVGLTAEPASAAARDGNCEGNEFCLYQNENFGPPVFDLYDSDPSFADDTYPTDNSLTPNNDARSYWNRDDYTWCVYDRRNYTGAWLRIEQGDGGNLPQNLWDRISSARYVGDNETC
jgi:hypothetical protein